MSSGVKRPSLSTALADRLPRLLQRQPLQGVQECLAVLVPELDLDFPIGPQGLQY